MTVMCFAGLAIDSTKIILSAMSLSLAISIVIILKKFSFSNKSKIGLLYGHLLFLFYPFVLLTTQVTCGMLCISACSTASNSMANLMLLSLPTTFFLATVVGFAVIPLYYIHSNKKREIISSWIQLFVKNSSSVLKIRQPKVFAIDKAQPLAFSFRYFRSAIFLSVGLLDILDKKEIEAVLLHELAHIKQKTSALRLSLSFFRLFSPLSIIVKFHHEKADEEKKADLLATKLQKTHKYIKSARNRIGEYEKQEQYEF